MNILIIAEWVPTKSNITLGSFITEQADCLVKFGHNVIVVGCDTYSIKHVKEYVFYKEKRDYEKNGVKYYRNRKLCLLKSRIHGYREASRKCIEDIYKRIIKDQIKIDIIHAHCCVWAGYIAQKISEKYNIPYIITEHSTLYKLEPELIQSKEKKVIYDAFKNANKVIGVGGELVRILKEYTNNITVLGNVIDCDLFYLDKERMNKEQNFKFFSLCHMESEEQLKKKGIDILVKAFAEVLKKNTNVELVIGGGGKANRVLERWCKDYKIENNVKIVGALNRRQVAYWMQMCNCFVLPSRYETFGVVYIEAMSCGKPVIATRNGGADDLIFNFNGLLCDVEDVKGLTKCMNSMILNYTKYDPHLIRNYVINNFSSLKIAERLTKLYSQYLKL